MAPGRNATRLPPDPKKHRPKKASLTDKWSRVHPGPSYKHHYTFNDNTLVDMIEMLFVAAETYDKKRFRAAALKAANFILLAQLPEPQPAWAQQYDANMRPTWARRFEPPAASGRESQDILLSLLEVYRRTGESKYLEPIPRAVAYLRRSQLDRGQLARFYEMKTNKPLYFTKDYKLTYDDSDLPIHYRFKIPSRLDKIETEYEQLSDADFTNPAEAPQRSIDELRQLARGAVAGLTDRGEDKAAWLEVGAVGGGISGQGAREKIIKSETFVRQVRLLSEYLKRTTQTK